MPRRQPRAQRLATAARWPLGVALTSWRYLWRLTPVERWEWTGSPARDSGPQLPARVDRHDVQGAEDGAGPLVHRLYRVRMRTALSPEQLMARLARDLDAVAPSEFASFQKLSGEPGDVRVDDEYVVRMPGPWDGPVRVVDRTPTAFRLATLTGHLEAGQIEFRARRADGTLEFTIESWARSGDRLSNLMYTHLRLSKEVQLHMWTSVLERVVELAQGTRHGPLAILTRRVAVDEDASAHGDPRLVGPRDARSRRKLAELAERELNLDLAGEHSARNGWHVDEVIRELPAEAPGQPEPGGVWETARRLMIDYQIADPDVVEATYRADVPLAGRDMLLRVRFAGLIRFHVGVRIGDDYDETRTIDDRPVRVFGWDYATLAGHFEQGRLHYEVWKWLDTGVVEFRLRAYSKTAAGGPLALRLGYRVFGRSRQLAFYREAARRVAGLTATSLELDRDEAPPRVGQDPARTGEFAASRR